MIHSVPPKIPEEFSQLNKCTPRVDRSIRGDDLSLVLTQRPSTPSSAWLTNKLVFLPLWVEDSIRDRQGLTQH